MSIHFRTITLALIFSLLCIGCKHSYVLRKAPTKQNGFILIDDENRIFFVASAHRAMTVSEFIRHHKRDGVWIRGNYLDASMDSLRSDMKHLTVRKYSVDGAIASFGFAPVSVKYSMIDRAPKWVHNGGVYNCVFYLDSTPVRFNYYEAQYKILELRLRHVRTQ